MGLARHRAWSIAHFFFDEGDFFPLKYACAARQISKMGPPKVASGVRSTTTAPISVLPWHNCVSLLVLTIYIGFWLFPNWSHTAYPKISHLLKSQIRGISLVSVGDQLRISLGSVGISWGSVGDQLGSVGDQLGISWYQLGISYQLIPNWTQFGSAILKRCKIAEHCDDIFPHPLLW